MSTVHSLVDVLTDIVFIFTDFPKVLLSSIVVLDQSHGIKHAHGICFSVMSLSQIIAGQLREVSLLLSNESSNLRKLVDTHRNHAMHAGRAQAGELRVPSCPNIWQNMITIIPIIRESPLWDHVFLKCDNLDSMIPSGG